MSYVGKLVMAVRHTFMTSKVGYATVSVKPGMIFMVVDEGISLHVLHENNIFIANKYDFEVCKPSKKLEGKSFCFTGTVSRTRDFWKLFVELNGGEFKTTVSRELDYLVMGDTQSKSTKSRKAKSYGTTCITENVLYNMIHNNVPL